MTDKQKEAIEYFKKRIDICMENANICDDNDFDEEATCLRKEQILTETVVNLLQTQQAEIEKKDKIIDEMATYIATLDIEEDICEKTKNEHCDKMNFGECEDCIKQYFERKAKNE